jgi:hypothetical protein
VRSSDNRYELCADPARLKQAIELARQARVEDETWLQLHYLWPQHPHSHYLQPGEPDFVMLSLMPNRKGQPLLVDWQVACRQPGQPFGLEPSEVFMQRAGLQAGQLPSPGGNLSLQDL